ncbi:Ku protein [Chelatococcus composti]|jgi:DNA end-binding protein Ku|uniref:Non-homologous end joining protein Ku n=1 Tax=Chelatococcus composti TaxID=1743235 RepID=A0A841KC14_9HYPH|nr:Ku protein [Chelatococcus composti]MBB6166809.1 DNA end-binding protein Ku [Chelatococcus composti]MBS7734265.1 Ku protein [Chelatococcus composti]GGG25609.1 non-homologous end joining protein Ku [Chelatococcus composti]
MAERPVWKGQLRLSLVSIPVEMYSATNSSARVAFRQIHKPSGKRVQYQKVVPGVGPVKNDDIWKGYEVEDDEYVLIDPDEIDAIRLETKKTLELVHFVDACEIPPLYFDRPYFLAPTDELAEDAFRVVRDALAQTRKAGLGQLAMRGREYLVAVRPCGSGLMAETLHYEEEIRKTDPFFSSISSKPAEKDLLDVARQLIERKSGPFDASAFEDRYAEAIRNLVEEKAKGRKPRRVRAEEEARPRGGNVVDLMSALKQSLEKSGKKQPQKKPAAKAGSSSRRRKSA